ncbi:TonB-dependent receptor [Phaeocystidibacter luteus]|uniref:TonB-dependent receptor n=1 Tax=Phaeocystidibacter luteus TaxID=911197 RepID=A0A6N6RJ14_9FLAO|nr:TonB-dependent receptor plug domain-containing protein [Phaeocystidibacter luteus]KAB2814292.1 TonB-dependent receptor [Phaeocystidibacter luteus]
MRILYLFAAFCIAVTTFAQEEQLYKVVIVDQDEEEVTSAYLELSDGRKVAFPQYDGRFVYSFKSSNSSEFIKVVQTSGIGIPEGPKVDYFTVYPDSINVLEVKRIYSVLPPVDVGSTLTSGNIKFRSSGAALDDDHIRERAGNSLSEAIDVLPGVHAVNTGVGIAKPMIRGFIGNRVQVVDNGIRQEGQQWGMDHGLEIDQFSVDEVEVISGPSAIAEGPGMLTGVVRINPKWESIKTGFSGTIQGLGKTNNRLYGGSGLLNYRSTNQRLIVSARASVQDFADYRVPDDQFIYNGFILPLPNGILKNTAGTELNFKADVRYMFNSDEYLTYTFSVFDQVVGLFPGATGIPRAFDIGEIGDQRNVATPNQETRHYKHIFDYQVSRGYYTHTLNIGIQENIRRERSQPHGHGLTYIDSSNTLALGLNLTSIEAKYSTEYAKDNYSLSGGLNYQNKANRISGWEFLIPAYDRNEFGAFFLMKWRTSDWNYSAGVRLDGANTNVQGHSQPYYAEPDSLVERVAPFTLLQVRPSVTLGLSKQLGNHGINGHVSYLNRLPAVNELASNGVHHGTFRHEVGNPDLDPESGYVGELNAFLNFEPLSIKMTGFGGYYSNFIYLNPSGRFSPLPDAGQLYQYEQSAMVQFGGEVSATYDIYLGSKAWNDYLLHLTLIGEYVSATSTETNLPLPFQPPLGVTFIPEFERTGERSSWSVGSELQFVAAQDRVARNELTTPGYGLIHIYAGYSDVLSNGNEWGVSVRIQNLTNQSYLRHLSRYRILNLPEQGINFILQVKYSF